MGTIKILSNKLILTHEDGSKETLTIPRNVAFEVGQVFVRFRGQMYT
jgi:hypothetical protein